MSVEEMVAWIESGIAISDKGGFVVPVADLAALIADWRKRGEALEGGILMVKRFISENSELKECLEGLLVELESPPEHRTGGRIARARAALR